MNYGVLGYCIYGVGRFVRQIAVIAGLVVRIEASVSMVQVPVAIVHSGLTFFSTDIVLFRFRSTGKVYLSLKPKLTFFEKKNSLLYSSPSVTISFGPYSAQRRYDK